MVSKANAWLVCCSKANWFILLSQKCVPKQIGNDSNLAKGRLSFNWWRVCKTIIKKMILWRKELGTTAALRRHHSTVKRWCWSFYAKGSEQSGWQQSTESWYRPLDVRMGKNESAAIKPRLMCLQEESRNRIIIIGKSTGFPKTTKELNFSHFYSVLFGFKFLSCCSLMVWPWGKFLNLSFSRPCIQCLHMVDSQ